MKTRLFIILFAAMLSCFVLSVQAATMDPVKFYLVDTDNNDRVGISNTGNWPFDLNLDWSYDGSEWSDWSPALLEFNKNAESYAGVVYLSIVVNGIRDTGGDVIFDGGGIKENDDWYSSVLIRWSDSPHLSFLTLKPDDAVSPIPITSSALLLGSGVFGLMMVFSRKKS
jgi:hypothetical protein